MDKCNPYSSPRGGALPLRQMPFQSIEEEVGTEVVNFSRLEVIASRLLTMYRIKVFTVMFDS